MTQATKKAPKAAVAKSTASRRTSQKPSPTSPGTSPAAAPAASDRNIMLLNEEAFDGVMEMQMSFFEAASRFAREFSDFAARRTEANVGDLSKFAEAKSPPELLQMHLEHMRKMFEDYSMEASRLLAITEDVMKESGEAVRSSYLSSQDTKKAG